MRHQKPTHQSIKGLKIYWFRSFLLFPHLPPPVTLAYRHPPLPEQHEIVRRVESLFALADRIEQRVTVGKERVDRLTQSILAKAFRGELVPTEAELARREGRSYEPAGVLLERIKVQNELKSG